MSSDALFQLGNVAVSPSKSQEEERLCRLARPVRMPMRRASARPVARRPGARLHPMQDQVSRSRTPT